MSVTGRARVARTVRTWFAFALSALIVLGGMAWVTTKALTLERERGEAQRDADHEERVRLALWRMDSAVAPLIGRESARSHTRYVRAGDEPEEPEPDVVLRFVTDEDGHRAIRDANDPERIDSFEAQLEFAALDAIIPAGELAPGESIHEAAGWRDVALPAAPKPRARTRPKPRDHGASNSAEEPRPPGDSQQVAPQTPSQQQLQPAQQAQQVGGANLVEQNAVQQQRLNDNEFLRRAISVQKQSSSRYGSSLTNYGQTSVLEQANAAANLEPTVDDAPVPVPTPLTDATPKPPPRESTPPKHSGKRKRVRPDLSQADVPVEPALPVEAVSRVIEVREGVMHPVWMGDRLLLARRATAGDARFVEGALIDVDAVSATLTAEVADLLPNATLEPVTGPAQDTQRLLATLPFRLIPGAPTEALLASTLTLPLLAAWISVFLAALGAFVLLRSALALSERRGAFVSAVTHELRTPLTTFRMYTEMLAEGMVEDETRRAQYLDTLRREAHRLDNLVQNVLAYARIEDDRGRARVESLPLGELVAQVRPRLEERLGQAEMELVLEVPDEVMDTSIRADRTAAEQILFNLVDNAAKYGVSDGDRRVHLSASVTGDTVALRVRDHGPGVPPDEAAAVFRPFAKARAHAAGTAPGVGLGLALCRRLAAQLGGELVLEPGDEGACFRFTLPRA